MEEKNNFRYFINNLNLKHRLSMLNEHNHQEVWYMHISPLKAIGFLLALVLVLFIVILTTVAYTPVLDLIPGYPGNKSRELLVENIMRLDSLERELTSMQVYADNVSLIMEGKTPVERSVADRQDTLRRDKEQIVASNKADSILRAQMEGQGIYSLGASSSRARAPKGAVSLQTPVKGVVANHFDPRSGRFGVEVATATNQQVTAAREGTVILSMWTPDDGHIVQIQHSGNMTTIYRHLASTLKQPSARVKAGEVIGYTGEGVSGEAGKAFFEFELWIDGISADPEAYMIF